MFHQVIAVSLVLLAVFAAAFTVKSVMAEAAGLPLAQDDGYPPPEQEPDPGYPEPGEGDYPSPLDTVTGPIEPVGTITITLTLAPDIFRTEQAEMGDTLVTPPAGQTPVPSHTPINTVTVTPTATVTPTPVVMVTQEEGFGMDWGLFAIGFALPILTSSGVVLYFLDRRPDLFSPRPKR